MRKRELDREVALQLGKSPRVVGIITRVFLYEVMRELINMNAVRLDGLGELSVGVRKGGVDCLRTGSFTGGQSQPLTVKSKRKVFVSFRKARPFNEAIRVAHGSAGEIA